MKFISKKTSDRVCNHMNADHKDSVEKYLRYYTDIREFDEANLTEINSKNMIIEYDGKKAVISFAEEISENDIHKTLVSMIKNVESI